MSRSCFAPFASSALAGAGWGRASALCALVLCSACTDSAQSPPPAEIPLRTAALLDRSHNDVLAATFTVPQDWETEGEVVWNYDDVSLPFQSRALARSPDGRAWVQAYPTLGFYWLEPPDPARPRGARHLGLIHQPPPDAAEALMRFVIDPARAGERSLEVVGMRQIPDLAARLGQPNSPGRGLAIRVRYERGGERVSEEFLANYVTNTGFAGGIRQHNVYLDMVHSLGAPEAEFERWRPGLTAIATSFAVHPEWEALAAQLTARLQAAFSAQIAQGLAQIQAAAQASRMIARHYDEIRAMQRDSWEYHNEVTDRASRQWSDTIRGVERMRDPLWGESEQPYEYEYHWTDGLGNYRHSNDPNWNPNTAYGSGPEWSLMQAADP